MDTVAASRPRSGIHTTFAALKNRNFRLWFVGQIVSLFGTWMQNTAQGFLIYELTRSPAYLGYVGFVGGVPAWIFTLVGGVVADRAQRRRVLVATQTAMMVLAFVLAALAAYGAVEPWHILVLAALLGVTNAFDAPARQAFVVELVPREHITNAIALNSTMYNSATVVGPAAAGLIYALFGAAWCFTLNGLSFLAVIAALLLMKLPGPELARNRKSPLADIKEGLHLVFTHPVVRVLIILLAAMSMFGASFSTLFPAWAVDVLGGDATTNGLLRSAQGVGALIGALIVASRGSIGSRGKLLTIGTFVFPVALLVFAATRALPLALLALAVAGLALVLIFNLANALVQSNVPDALRGRVMSVYTLTFFGGLPLGSVFVGEIAARVNEPIAIAAGAILVLVCALLTIRFAPRVRALE